MGVEMNRSVIDAALTRMAHRWADTLGREVTDRARAILAERGHIDQGTLAGSIEHTVIEAGPSGAKVIVGSPLDYAGYFHTGTGIYGPQGKPIVPTREKSATGGPPFLKFLSNGAGQGVRMSGAMARSRGQFVFARSVKGMRADPFLSDALVDVIGRDHTTTRTP